MTSTSELSPRLRMVTVRLYRLVRQQADPGDDLSPNLVPPLGTINRCGPIALGRLAELERVQPPSMTRIVAKLEDRGLVRREIDATDRRVARVQVTQAATDLLTELRSRRTEFLATRLAE